MHVFVVPLQVNILTASSVVQIFATFPGGSGTAIQ